MQFQDLIGQREVAAHLREGVQQGRISHAQLLVGSEGVGALPVALAYIQYILCTNRTQSDSCGACASCHQVQQLAHPDLHCVFPVNWPKGKSTNEKPLSSHFMAQWRELGTERGARSFNEAMWYEAIGIENKQGNISTFEAEEIIRSLSFKAFASEYKVVLMWLPERMNVQAANRLLKILEEPWEKTLFVLVSESPDTLLPTILSRTQRIDIPGIDNASMEAWLLERGATAQEAAHLVRLSRGNLLAAERFLNEMRSGESAEFFELFVGLMRLSYGDKHLELLEWADSVASLGREEQKRLLRYCIDLLRSSYMLTAGAPELAYLFGKEAEFCRSFAPFVANHNIEALIAELELALRQVGQNGNPRLIFPHSALTISKLIVKL